MANLEVFHLPIPLETSSKPEAPTNPENFIALFWQIIRSTRFQLLPNFLRAQNYPSDKDSITSGHDSDRVLALLPGLIGPKLITLLTERHSEEVLGQARKELCCRAERYFRNKNSVEYEEIHLLENPLRLRLIIFPDQLDENTESFLKDDLGFIQLRSESYIFDLDLLAMPSDFQEMLFPSQYSNSPNPTPIS